MVTKADFLVLLKGSGILDVLLMFRELW